MPPEPGRPAVAAPPSLLQSLQSLLERTYRMKTGIVDIGRFVIGDEGYRLFYGPGGRASVTRVAASAAAGARVLVHDGPGPLSARIYYPDSLIRSLERCPPSRGLGDENIDPFATFVEELDHLLLIAERGRLRRPVSLLELELHANVTKYLVCALFLAPRRGGRARAPLDPQTRLWLRWHLFEKIAFAEPDPKVSVRYSDASRFARRFLDRLDREPDASSRLARLRAFHAATHQEKLAELV